MNNDDFRDVPRTLAASLTLWVGAVAAGTSAGVFLRLPHEAYAALAAFATLFAASVVLVDARVRGWFAQREVLAAKLAALGFTGVMVAAGAGLSRSGEIDPAAMPWAPILLFAMPVSVALLVAAVRSSRGRRDPAPTGRGLRTGNSAGVAGG